MQKDNKGFSLVELIIVVTLITVLGAGITFTVGLIFSGNAKTCAGAVKTAVNDCKVNCMSKTDAYMEITRGSDDCVYVQHFVKNAGDADYSEYTDRQKIGRENVTVEFGDSKTAALTSLSGGNKITISYDRGTGGFKDTVPAYIHITGGTKDYDINLIKLTGKIELIEN